MQLRGKPKIAFHYDRDAEKARRVEELLKEERLRHPVATEAATEAASEPTAAEVREKA
jgi:hypothetical protein